MSADAATEFDAKTKELGDKIVGLTLLEAKKVVDYLKEVHGIEPAGGGAVVMAGPAPVAEAKVEQTEMATAQAVADKAATTDVDKAGGRTSGRDS